MFVYGMLARRFRSNSRFILVINNIAMNELWNVS